MQTDERTSGFHGFHARNLRGEDVDFSRYDGKVVLAVNTASKCGFTPQYAGLEELYKKYEGDGLVILGFPCNQFGNQEPGDAQAIESTCLVNYGVSFPVFEKVDVNGPRAHPVFRWLTTELPGLLGRSIKWNFTKFLIGRDGRPIRRFAPITTPAKVEPAIREALGLRG
ncbi:Hydroperoxy fatty acid reductase gpx1 [Aquisphaera giovannonii]|uniref:Glutathione peroxidase n=1 Tax=Aquisphaera giovannonii TaxID=406548 RepID=A0A5B9W9T6_9BACT|nr:glutathione peroxidase [Aquisphaera giovannonii]QEH37342.1 Hydroperoxy fatty acid reductase gpx1 [Aquisphaera giovannonii]